MAYRSHVNVGRRGVLDHAAPGVRGKGALRSAALFASSGLLLSCAEPDAAVDPAVLARAGEESACSFTEVITPAEFDTTERSGLTADGRLFFIGTRPGRDGLSESWLAEIASDANGGPPVVRDVLLGTLAGTRDGTLGGPAEGDPCLLSGMATHQMSIYAGCYSVDGRVSLLQVDLERGTVRAGVFTTCNAEPATTPCEPIDLYPNGMAVDDGGRIYTTSMLVHVTGEEGAPTIVQIEVDAPPAEPSELSFRHRGWLVADGATDGYSPNGVQIEGDTLYYAAGSNLNAVPMRADGRAGRLRVHFQGPLLSYIDDFSVHEGAFVLGRTLPGDLAELAPASGRRGPREVASCWLPNGAVPSSVTRIPASPSSAFSAGTYVVTAFFGGGLYTLSSLR